MQLYTLGLALAIASPTFVKCTPLVRQARAIPNVPDTTSSGTHTSVSSIQNATSTAMPTPKTPVGPTNISKMLPDDPKIGGVVPLSVLNASGNVDSQMLRDISAIVVGFGVGDSDSGSKEIEASAFGNMFGNVFGNNMGKEESNSSSEGGDDGQDMLAKILMGFNPKSGSQVGDGRNVQRMMQVFGLAPSQTGPGSSAPGGKSKLNMFQLMDMFKKPPGGASPAGGGLGGIVGNMLSVQKDTPGAAPGGLGGLLNGLLGG